MSKIFKLNDLEELTINAEQIQDDLLKEILTLNSNTEYLQRFLHGSTDKETFKKNVPLVSYEDVKPYIYRVANGEPPDVISGGPVTRFFRSSGTSGGEQKIFPANDMFIEQMGNISALRSFVLSKLRRSIGLIGALEIRVVQQGTFDSLMEYFIARGGSMAQYKTPICINSSEAFAVLEDKILARFYSGKSPPFNS